MKQLYISQCYALLLSALLFGPHTLLQAQDDIQAADAAACNQTQESHVYVRLDDSASMLRQVVADMSQFDTDLDSPLHLLRRHLENGYVIGLHDEVRSVLEYAYWFAGQNQEILQQTELCNQFENVINQFVKGELNITEDAIMQSPALRLLTVNERMLVKEKALFKNIVVMDKKLRVHGHARFYDNVTFKKNVTIDGALSLQDEVVGCDLMVGCNINLNNSTSAAVGNINKAGERFIHNSGTNNTFVGVDAGNFTMTGTNNVGIGTDALTNNTIGDSNTAVGSQALIANTEGIANVALGVNTMISNTTGNANTAVGASALAHNITGNANTAVGASAMQSNTTGNANTGLGVTALQSNTTGNANTGVGASALQANTTGQNNTAAGANALQSNTTGENNTAVGNSALADNITGSLNTAVGTGALGEALSDTNTAVGYNALHLISGPGGSVAVGSLALAANTVGFQNTAIGTTALGANTTGINNVAVGYHTLLANTIGLANVAVGGGALITNVNGNNNTAVGNSAGAALTTGSNNVFVGASIAGATTSGSNNIYIDGSGSLNPADESSIIRIGNTTMPQTGCFIQGIYGVTTGVNDATAVLVDSNGQLGTVSSSIRYKDNVASMDDVSSAILQLNPVTFTYRSDASNSIRYGLIAEEVDAIFPQLVIKDKDGQPVTVRYEVLPVLLLNEVKKQQSEMMKHSGKIDALEKKVTALAAILKKMYKTA